MTNPNLEASVLRTGLLVLILCIPGATRAEPTATVVHVPPGFAIAYA